MKGYWVGDRFIEIRKSEWHDHDTDLNFIQTIFLLAFTVVMVFLAIVYIIIWANKTIRINNYQIKESQRINDQYKLLYESPANIDEAIISKQQMEERKKFYEAEELEKQKKALISAETEHAKKLCEPGSYIKIIDLDFNVRVKEFFGYEGISWEEVCFNVADTNSWKYISFHEYSCQCIAQNRPVYTSEYINFIYSGYLYEDGTTK